MARGDFVDAGYSSMDSPRTGCKAGFWWRYANTSQEAINTNSDIIEIFPYITRTTTNYSPYSNNNYYSKIDVYINNSSSTFDIYSQSWQNRYNYGNVSANTKYGLTSTYNSSNPFGYTAGTSTTRITTTTKDGKTIYGTRFTVPHNADGTAPRVVLNLILGLSDTHGGSITHSIEPSLDTIPRASQPTCAGTTLGVGTRINTNRVSNSFTHTLNIKIGSTTIETFTGIGDYKDWTPAISTYLQYIPSTSGTITIECITYSNGSEIGRATTSCVLTVPNNSDTKPTLTLTVSKGDNVVPNAWGVYVKGKSKLAISIVGSSKAGTSIASYYSTANGSSDTRSSYTTSELTGSGTVTANVKDGRGFTSDNATASYTVEDYTNPQITTNTVARCNSSGTLTDDGTYVKWSFQGSISSVSNKNAKTFTLKYAEKGTNNWTTIYTYNSGYTLPNDATTIDVISGGGNIDITKEYVFRFEATDSFTTTAKEVEIGTVADLINYNASGTSMAIGGVSQRGASSKTFDMYLTSVYHKPVQIEDCIQGKTFGGNGSSGYFYVCDITTTGQYSNQFIEFTFLQRPSYMKVALVINGNATVGAISSVNGYIVTSAQTSATPRIYYLLSNNVVKLYVLKMQGYDEMEVFVNKGKSGNVNIDWIETNYNISSLPSGNTQIMGANARLDIQGNSATSTKATQDSNGLEFNTNYAKARTTGATSFDDISDKLRRSGLYSEQISNTWYNLINIRHRNGESDGTSYGLQIRNEFNTNKLQIRNQYGNSWKSWRSITFTDDFEEGSNTNGNYIKYPNGTMICYRTVNISGSVSSWGSMYYLWDATQWNFATSFISKPVVNLSVEPTNSNGCWIASPNQPTITKDYIKGIGVARPTSSSLNVNIHIIAIGKWK